MVPESYLFCNTGDALYNLHLPGKFFAEITEQSGTACLRADLDCRWWLIWCIEVWPGTRIHPFAGIQPVYRGVARDLNECFGHFSFLGRKLPAVIVIAVLSIETLNSSEFRLDVIQDRQDLLS
jgi:hypothetical protein